MRLAAVARALFGLGLAAYSAVWRRCTVRSRGLRFTLRCDSALNRYRWRTYNTKEPETLDWLDLRMRDGDVLFDVGANVGVYSLYAALRHPRSRVVAFEPEYANLYVLRDNVVANGLADRIAMYSVALGARTGPTWLHVQDLTPGAALHTESANALARTRTGRPILLREGVYVVTLDDFCAATGLSPNCVKIDVDGTEPQVLHGARATLADAVLRTVLLEMPSDRADAEECARLLSDAGLEPAGNPEGTPGENQVWVRGSVLN